MWLASKGVLYVGPAYLPRTKLEDERICSLCLPTSLPLLDRDRRLPKHQTPLPVSVDILRAKLMLGASGVMAEKEALAQAPSPRAQDLRAGTSNHQSSPGPVLSLLIWQINGFRPTKVSTSGTQQTGAEKVYRFPSEAPTLETGLLQRLHRFSAPRG